MLTRRHHHRSRSPWTLSVYVFFIGSIFLQLTGCSSLFKARVETRYVHDTLAVHHRDSIHLRDSVYVREWVRGDTVFVDRWHDRVYYRDRWCDSIRVVRDSVAVERVKEVKVERPLNAWQRFRIGAFWWLLALAAALAAWTFRQPLLGIAKKVLSL